ncbi:D-galactarolactone isomerase [Devosia enhydra]|uniref:D-galactarolactone isomerase n=1 Tax=Devosia enhydra TaxID=665118 RepID=A0A1K2HXY4_9HYPH|nr:amidohydrolase family protein [Devosia enhydra]SFZ84605.1 D-galactarolactone isomerase [Devosia enhydra]
MIERSFSGAPPQTKAPAGTIDTQMHVYMPGFPSAPGFIPLPENAPGPDAYRQVMAWLGIERVVITQGNAHGLDNANVLACIAAMGACARGVGVVTRETPPAEMRRLADAGIVGARIMDLAGGAVGLDRLAEVDRHVRDYGWCLAVQFDGSTILSHEDLLAGLSSRWILDHHGKFFAGIRPDDPEIDCVKRLLDTGRCYYKLAGCYESSRSGGPGYEDIAAVTRVIAAHAPERIIWGTNWPHNGARRTADYPDDARLFDTVMSWLPSDAARHLCLVDNPAALYFGA